MHLKQKSEALQQKLSFTMSVAIISNFAQTGEFCIHEQRLDESRRLCCHISNEGGLGWEKVENTGITLD